MIACLFSYKSTLLHVSSLQHMLSPHYSTSFSLICSSHRILLLKIHLLRFITTIRNLTFMHEVMQLSHGIRYILSSEILFCRCCSVMENLPSLGALIPKYRCCLIFNKSISQGWKFYSKSLLLRDIFKKLMKNFQKGAFWNIDNLSNLLIIL